MNGRAKGGGVAGSLVEEWVALVLLHSFDYFMCEEETNKTKKKNVIYVATYIIFILHRINKEKLDGMDLFQLSGEKEKEEEQVFDKYNWGIWS
jgi:hypothetical protein